MQFVLNAIHFQFRILLAKINTGTSFAHMHSSTITYCQVTDTLLMQDVIMSSPAYIMIRRLFERFQYIAPTE